MQPHGRVGRLRCLCAYMATSVCRCRISMSAVCCRASGSLHAPPPPPPEPASGHAAQRADRGGASCGAGPRRAGFPGGGALVRPVRRPELPPRSSARAAPGLRAPPVPSRAMLPWTALGLALSLRLALARSGAERGECGSAGPASGSRYSPRCPRAAVAPLPRPRLGGGPHPPVAGAPRCPRRLDQAQGRGGSRLPRGHLCRIVPWGLDGRGRCLSGRRSLPQFPSPWNDP